MCLHCRSRRLESSSFLLLFLGLYEKIVLHVLFFVEPQEQVLERLGDVLEFEKLHALQIELLEHSREALGHEGVGEEPQLVGRLVLAVVAEVLAGLVHLVHEAEVEPQQEHHAVDDRVSLPDFLPQLLQEMREGELRSDGWHFILYFIASQICVVEAEFRVVAGRVVPQILGDADQEVQEVHIDGVGLSQALGEVRGSKPSAAFPVLNSSCTAPFQVDLGCWLDELARSLH